MPFSEYTIQVTFIKWNKNQETEENNHPSFTSTNLPIQKLNGFMFTLFLKFYGKNSLSLSLFSLSHTRARAHTHTHILAKETGSISSGLLLKYMFILANLNF
jgi:hypothetical protein